MSGTAEIRVLVLYYISNVIARRWLVLATAWTVCMLGWAGVASLSNSYTSEAKIYVDTQSLLGPLMKDLAIQPDVDSQLDIMRRTLFNRANVEKIIRKTDLDLSIDDTPEAMEGLIKRMSTAVEMEVDRANLFTFSYSAKDPELAQRVVDTTLQIFVEMNLGNTQEDMEDAQRFIDQQIGEYELKLRRAEIEVADYKRRYAIQLGNADRNLRSMEATEAKLDALRAELQAGIWQRNQLEVRHSTIPRYLKLEEAPERDPTRVAMEEQLLFHRSELGRLLTQFTDRHPDVISARNRIVQAEAALAGLQTPDVTKDEFTNPLWEQLNVELEGIVLNIASVENRIKQTEDDLEVLSRRVAEAPAAEAELVHLTRDYEVLVKQYERLIEKRESARLGQRLGAEADSVEFRVVEPPLIPISASGPPRLILLAVVLVLAAGAGVGLAVLRILLTDAFMGSRQLGRSIGLPVIGVLPVTRSILSARRKFAEALAAGLSVAALLCIFGGLAIYFVQNPDPPTLPSLVKKIAVASILPPQPSS